SAFAYLLWFEIVRRLPATTASLGVLSAPAVGVIASMLVLGERPSIHDIIGFVLILAAAACVLLAPTTRSPEAVPIEQRSAHRLFLEVRHGVDLSDRRWLVRDRVGDRAEIHRWLHTPPAVAMDPRQHDPQHR